MEILSKIFFNISKNKQNLYIYFLKFVALIHFLTNVYLRIISNLVDGEFFLNLMKRVSLNSNFTLKKPFFPHLIHFCLLLTIILYYYIKIIINCYCKDEMRLESSVLIYLQIIMNLLQIYIKNELEN